MSDLTHQDLNELINLCKLGLTAPIPEVNEIMIKNINSRFPTDLLDIHGIFTHLLELRMISYHNTDEECREYLLALLDNLRDPIDINHTSKFIKLISRIESVLSADKNLSTMVINILVKLRTYQVYLSECNLKSGGKGLPVYWRNRHLTDLREIINEA